LGILLAAGLLLAAGPVQADQYRGNGDTGFGGAIGNSTLTLSDDGTNISGTLTVGGSMNDVLVLYIQSGPGGFTNTSGFNDQGDSCRQAISGVSTSGRSLLTFASGFQPNYAIALAPAAVGKGSLWQLANGGTNSLVLLGSVNLAPMNYTGPYTFSFPAAHIGMIPGVRSTIQVFGTYVRIDGSRSTEAIAGNLMGVQGWNPSTQTSHANYTFDADAVLVKLALRIWAQGASGGPPTGRYNHTAVWTGTEMIVWGGSILLNPYYSNDGGRYNPAANSWMALPISGAPSAREYHTAVWTGTEMIVWGGRNVPNCFNDGGRYNPTANSWTALPTSGAPAGRYNHTAVWTGSEMIAWGGWNGSSSLNDGGRYNPSAKSWTALPTASAPAARFSHTAVWTGNDMIVWGGRHYDPSNGESLLNDGGRYNPTANSWTALPTSGAPARRYNHTAVWTGSEMIAWGGSDLYCFHSLNDGGRYNPSANSWTAVATKAAVTARYCHTAVWTGSEMIVWGGYDGSSNLNDGGCYNPVANSWAALSTAGAPAARWGHTAVWTGREMTVWGGGYNDGGRYNPSANTWTALPTTGAPAARVYHTAVWTGHDMIVWGGRDSGFLNTGGRYDPAANSWLALPTSGAPSARVDHTAVWTGGEMIVWGGLDGWGGGYLNTGGRYNPVANSWMALPTAGAPTGRGNHTAVWTGSEMITWGGWNSSSSFKDGGRYNPSANTWTALPTTVAPAARSFHTAVWTGTEMILWAGTTNGSFSGVVNDGGRYNPVANSWAALSTTGAPAARYGHTAVWTGCGMIVWAGYSGTGSFSDTLSYYPYAPAVRISQSSGASAVVAWPVWHPTFRLWQTTNLAEGQWTTVTNALTQVGSENRVTVSPLNGRQFFRAEYP
jgi:N-acetylneuraminic acid mutarotase